MVDDRDDRDSVPTLRQERTRLGVGNAGDGEPSPLALPLPAPTESRPARSGASSGSLPPMIQDDRYTLGAQIGQGGMGEVVVAVDEHLGREVAVKRIRAAAPSEEELARFVREARVQGRLQHPAVVPVHDLAVDRDGRPFFVMKRLSGIEMNDLLKRMRAGDEADEAGSRRRMLRAFADVCLAVEFAHSHGIIHRDLKPANIMLGDFGEVYVLDWGVARMVTSFEDSPTRAVKPGDVKESTAPFTQHDLDLGTGETHAGTVLGTPAYMAPEQLAGDRVGPAADIYALGCILFEIVAGEPLHPRTRTIGQALTLTDTRPSVRRPDSPPEFDAICLRATAIEEDDRFRTARELGAAVQAYLDGNRDVAIRGELAQHHIADARAALARGNDEQHRIAAIRAAGRALALDPTSTEAGDLVTHIILQPPREVPAEVERQLVVLESDAAKEQGRLAAISILGYLAFVPFLLWTGLNDPLVVIAMCVLAVAGSAHVYVLTRGDGRVSKPSVYVNATIQALLIAVICRILGPFIIVPTLVIATLMAFAAHPQFGRIRIVSVILTAGVAVPWLLEVIGVLEPTYRFEHGSIILTSPALMFEPVPTQIAFALLLVMVVTLVAFLLRTIANRHRDATRRLELQAWHLRQIVPTTAR